MDRAICAQGKVRVSAPSELSSVCKPLSHLCAWPVWHGVYCQGKHLQASQL